VGQGGAFYYSDPSGIHSVPQVSEVKYWTYSAYTEGQWQMLDRLKVVGGIRITKDDHYQQVPIMPRASLIYTATDYFTVKYMYTDAFVAPAPYFSYATYENSGLIATTNPAVAPETAQTHELNFAYNKEWLSLSMSFYYGTQANLIILSDQATSANLVESGVTYLGTNPMALVPSGTRDLVHTANGGVSERYGADFYGKINGEVLSPWWSYSYVDFEQTVDNITTGLPGTSKHNGRLGVTWKARPRLFITPSFAIQSTPQNVNPGALGSELETPWSLNLYMLYKYSEHVDVFADLKNLTDHHYALGGFTGYAMPQETFQGVVGARVMY
jgi:outer membrane receptor protein involved in Fe transport